MVLLRQNGRLFTLLMAAGCLTLALLSVMMTHLWMLNACYLCIFQRFLFMAVTLTLLIACWRWRDRLAGGAALVVSTLIALGGLGVATYQSWLQWFPELELSCGAGSQNLMEQTVEWLGRLSPTLFMATGFCEDDKFKIFALSLANWSLLCFLALSLACIALLYIRPSKRTPHA